MMLHSTQAIVRRFTSTLSVCLLATLTILSSTAAAEPGPTPTDDSVIRTIVGNGVGTHAGDGLPATDASINRPQDVAYDFNGNLFIADTENHRVRRVDGETGIITTIAGTETAGFSGDGGYATAARLNSPVGIAFDGVGNLHIADSGNHRVRRIDASSGIITTVVGTASPATDGDGGPAASASLHEPVALAFDQGNNLYIVDKGDHRVRVVDYWTGLIQTLAGNGGAGFSGDGGPAISAELNAPIGIAVDTLGNTFIADSGNHRIRRVTGFDFTISTVGGTGTPGFAGDGGPAVDAQLHTPSDIAVDEQDHLFIADAGNGRVRRLDLANGTIDTVAGSGATESFGDEGSARVAGLAGPASLAIHSDRTLVVADTDGHRIRSVVIDAAPPTINLSLAATANRFGPRSTVEFSCDDSLALHSCVAMLNGEPVTSGHELATSSLIGGTIEVTAVDQSGQVTTTEQTFAVDWSVPGQYGGASETDGTIVRFYIATFGRLPDAEGFGYWNDLLTADADALQEVADFFTTSDEFNALYGSSVNDAEFVDTIYRNVLGRPPEQSGSSFWSDQLTAGTMSRGQIMEFFAQSPEHRIITGTD